MIVPGGGTDAHRYDPGLQGAWRARVGQVLALLLCHAAVLYGAVHLSVTGLLLEGPLSLFGPVIPALWQPRGAQMPPARLLAPAAAAALAAPPLH